MRPFRHGEATGMLLVGIVPVAWILYAMRRSAEVTRARATSTLIKLGVLTLAVNLWWISGLSGRLMSLVA